VIKYSNKSLKICDGHIEGGAEMEGGTCRRKYGKIIVQRMHPRWFIYRDRYIDR
jgi:hypothetical protein